MNPIVVRVIKLANQDISSNPVTWQSNSNDLARLASDIISSHWDEVTRHIVPPGIAWHWDECQVSHRVKRNWKVAGLIHRAPDGERWVTSEALWLHVIGRAGDDEPVGTEAHGQEMLPVTDEAEKWAKELANTETTRRGQNRNEQQATNSEDPVPISEIPAQLRADKPQKDLVNEETTDRVARDPQQTHLQLVKLHDLNAWEIHVPAFRSASVTEPQGAVY